MFPKRSFNDDSQIYLRQIKILSFLKKAHTRKQKEERKETFYSYENGQLCNFFGY